MRSSVAILVFFLPLLLVILWIAGSIPALFSSIVSIASSIVGNIWLLAGVIILVVLIYAIFGRSRSTGSLLAAAGVGAAGGALAGGAASSKLEGITDKLNLGGLGGGSNGTDYSPGRNSSSSSSSTPSTGRQPPSSERGKPRTKPNSSPHNDNNINGESNNGNMTDSVETTAQEMIGDLKEEENLDSKEAQLVEDAEKRLQDFLKRYKRDKDVIHLLEEEENGNLSRQEFYSRVDEVFPEVRSGGNMQNKWQQLVEDLESMKTDLENIMADMEKIEEIEQRVAQDSEETEEDAGQLEQHMNKLEAAIQHLNS